VCKHRFRDVVRDAQLRQAGTDDAAQIVNGPVRKHDFAIILAATAGHRFERSQHAPIQIALGRIGERQRSFPVLERKQVRPVLDARQRCDDLLCRPG
jgi:hypothetical protein